MNNLSEKQLRFIELWNGNATETAAAAGYAHAETAGKRCLQNVRICTEIKRKRDSELKPKVASRIERQEFWTDTMKNVEEKTADRLKASELLGKSEGDFLEKILHSGEVSIIPPALHVIIEADKKDG